MPRRFLAFVTAASLSACGKVADLEPAKGHALPVRPAMARTTPDAEALLTPPPYARPDRVDELVKKSEAREADPFDLAPAIGGAAPKLPAAADPAPKDDTTGPADPQARQ
jgi:hypothetical protein